MRPAVLIVLQHVAVSIYQHRPEEALELNSNRAIQLADIPGAPAGTDTSLLKCGERRG